MQITFLRVAVVIARLNPDQPYPKARSKDAVYLHQLSAAQRYGIYEPFEQDAAELNRWLTSVRAGRALCHDAWDLFMDEGTQDVSKRAALF
ncbi:MAG: hypothetical protein AAFP97_07405 [Pseudomonadota bacterium]